MPGRSLSSWAEEGRDSGTLELLTSCAGNSRGMVCGHHVPFMVTVWSSAHPSYISLGKAFTRHIYVGPGNRHKNSKGNSNSNFKQMSIHHFNILSHSWLRLFTKRSTIQEEPVFLPGTPHGSCEGCMQALEQCMTELYVRWQPWTPHRSWGKISNWNLQPAVMFALSFGSLGNLKIGTL